MTHLDFATTAVCRPQILDRTYSSFLGQLKGDWRPGTLYINIDPLPEKADPTATIEVARKHFPQVLVNTPARSSFPSAVKWCWGQPQTDYFFYLEDDWDLTQEVQVDKLLELLRQNEKLACINLRAYPIRDERICLSPGLWRSSAARVLAERLTLDANPEKQLRPTSPTNPIGDRHLGFLGRQFPDDYRAKMIRDSGREWLATQSEYEKDGGIHFTTWKPRDPVVTRPGKAITKPHTPPVAHFPRPPQIPVQTRRQPQLATRKSAAPPSSVIPVKNVIKLIAKPLSPRRPK
jgi:hypothetical protein